MFVCISITYIPFFINWKFWILQSTILDFSFNSGDQNREISKIRDNHFLEFQYFVVLRFSIASYFKTVHSSSLQIFADFIPKIANYDVTKTTFYQKNFNGFFFSEILVADVKLMLGKALKVSRRYLPLFLIYREIPAEGLNFLPPPAGRMLTHAPIGYSWTLPAAGGGCIPPAVCQTNEPIVDPKTA